MVILTLWASLGSFAASAHAEEPTSGTDSEAAPGSTEESAITADPEVEEIVITGSRIKRSGTFPSSAPVEVLDAKQIARSGARNLGELVQNLSNAPGSGIQGMGNGVADGRTGTATANLRGLGIGATLVLINGRRFVASAAGADDSSFSDMNLVPLGVVRRIEVLKGGASAVYGADAVAGVVNIITREDWSGLDVFVNTEAADGFDNYKGYTIGGTFGAHTDRAHIMMSAQWDLHTEFLARDRDWTKKGAHVIPIGYPGTFVNLGNGTVSPDPDCALAPNSSIVQVDGLDMCGFSDRDFVSIIPAVQRGNLFSSAQYKLTDHTEVFAETTASLLNGDQIQRPFFLLPAFSVTVPADHLDNPYGSDLLYSGRVEGTAPDRIGYTRYSYRVVAGIRGDFEALAKHTMFDDWEWELFATHGISHGHSDIPENNKVNLQAAINSCSDPSDLSGCFNPFYSSQLGTGTPNTDSVMAQIRSMYTVDAENGMRTYNGGMSGTLFELPGGPAGIAFGGQVREEYSFRRAGHEVINGELGTISDDSSYEVSRTVSAGYLELRLPVLPGLEVQGAGRVEYHDNIKETATNPTVGLTFTPSSTFEGVPSLLDRLTLRGHVARAFRAPTLVQASDVQRASPRQASINGTQQYVVVSSVGNPNLKSETAIAWSAGLEWKPIDELSIEAEYWDYHYKDRIAFEDYNGKLSDWASRNAETGTCDTSDPSIQVEGGASCLPGRVTIQAVNTPGKVVTNGIDFNLMARISGESFGGSRDDWGTLSAGVQGTYTLSYTVPRAEIAENVIAEGEIDCDGDSDTSACEVAGNRNATNIAPPLPRLTGNMPISWTYGGHSATLFIRYISPMENDQDNTTVHSFTTLDLQYGFTLDDWIGKSLNMRVGVINLFDKDPPSVATDQFGFEALTHDPRGRMFYARLSGQL